MAYYLGLDIGTSGTKALLMDADGTVSATATSPHEVYSPKAGWSEQAPDEWYSASVKATRTVLNASGIDGRQIVGIGLSGQMHGLVITDGAGKPLRRSIIWNDQRTAEQATQIEEIVGGKQRLIELVGNAAMTSFTLTKLLWVRQNEPGVYDRIRHFLLPKDYVRLRLTGEYVGEVSDMSGTLMFDQESRCWSDAILSRFEIDKGILPPVIESHEISGRLTNQAAEELGLAEGVPVVGGGGDQPAGAIGNGIVRAGLTSATIGTSGVVYVHSDSYRVDPESRVNTFCSCVAGQWCMFGCVMSAGGSFQWLRNTIGEEFVARARTDGVDPYDLMTEAAEKAVPGSGGVFFLPYLTGERTPHADPNARGAWIGLSATTTRGDLIRAVLEGITFAMHDVLSILRDRGVATEQIRLSGGGAKSAFWRQLQADVYGTECVTVNSDEGPAYGVALLAAVATGRFADIGEACESAISVTNTVRPDAARRKLYKKLHQQYQRLYPALKDEFRKLGELSAQ